MIHRIIKKTLLEKQHILVYIFHTKTISNHFKHTVNNKYQTLKLSSEQFVYFKLMYDVMYYVHHIYGIHIKV